MATCWNCGKSYEPPDLITRESECPSCAAFLRCCRNCDFYDPDASNNCREPLVDLQGDKETANTCDYFRVASNVRTDGSQKKNHGDFNDLFKD